MVGALGERLSRDLKRAFEVARPALLEQSQGELEVEPWPCLGSGSPIASSLQDGDGHSLVASLREALPPIQLSFGQMMPVKSNRYDNRRDGEDCAHRLAHDCSGEFLSGRPAFRSVVLARTSNEAIDREERGWG